MYNNLFLFNSSEEQVQKLRADGEKLQKLGMADKAEAKMLQVLELSPEDPVAWAFVEKRFRGTNRFAELKDLLVKAGESQRLTPEHRMQRLREAAAIAETRLRDVGASVDIYRLMVSLDPENAETRKAFERILTSAKRWDDLVTYLEEDTYRITDPERKYELLQRIADIHLLRRDDPRGAYRRALPRRGDARAGGRPGRPVAVDACGHAGQRRRGACPCRLPQGARDGDSHRATRGAARKRRAPHARARRLAPGAA